MTPPCTSSQLKAPAFGFWCQQCNPVRPSLCGGVGVGASAALFTALAGTVDFESTHHASSSTGIFVGDLRTCLVHVMGWEGEVRPSAVQRQPSQARHLHITSSKGTFFCASALGNSYDSSRDLLSRGSVASSSALSANSDYRRSVTRPQLFFKNQSCQAMPDQHVGNLELVL
jgi:hypothetical protein